MLWNAKNGRVPLGDTEMEYVSFGRGARHLIVLPGLSDGLATVGGKALLLAPPFRRFFDRYTVWMFSRKNRMPAGTAIRDMAEDQARAMESLGIGEAAVLGVSEGGMIAQMLAVMHPERVSALILAVTAPYANEMSRGCVNRWIGLAREGRHRELMIDTAERSYSPAYLKKYRKLYPLLGHVGRPASYDRFLVNAEAILSFDAREEIGRIACPALILDGEEDQIVGAEASRELHAGIPGSKMHLYPGLGHAAYEEAKDFYDRICDFLEA
ncbi:MAG: alpha/beta fold hydrolase [Clostridia bacterium]|nr:alpha/beta fold hydrolase [Clostridia bacterium]